MYYGWRIVAAAYVSLFISVGFLFYSFGVFFPALVEEFGGSRFAVAIGLAVMNVCMAIAAPFLGKAVDERSIRNIMLIGAVLLGFGFLLSSRITAIWQFYVLLGTLLGLGAAMVGQLPSSTLVSNWFVKRRGMALGIATMGVSMSGVVMAPVTTMLIARFGWRGTFVVFGVLAAAIVLPVVALIVVNRPEDMGLLPDGDSKPLLDPLDEMQHGHAVHFAEFSARGTIMQRNFWAITILVGLNFFSMGAILTHMIAHTRDMGIEPLKASFVITACAGVGVTGKLLFGYIADFVDTRIAMLCALGFQAAGTIILLNAHSYGALLAVGAVFGMGMGGIVPLWGSLIGEYFGRMSFGRVMGLMSPCMLPIQVGGVPFAGLVYDRTGSYTFAFQTFLGVYVIAALMLLVLRHPEVGEARESVAAG